MFNTNKDRINTKEDPPHLNFPPPPPHLNFPPQQQQQQPPQQQSPHMSHQQQQQQHPSHPPFNPRSNGFPFWSDQNLINNLHMDHKDHDELSMNLSAMTLLDEDHHHHPHHHHQGNNIIISKKKKIRVNNNVVDPMSHCWDFHAHNNTTHEDETVPLTPSRYHNMGIPKPTIGVSVSEGLMQKGNTFRVPQIGSSTGHVNNATASYYGCGHGNNVSSSATYYGCGYGRGVPYQPQNTSFASTYSNPYEQRVVYPPLPRRSFPMENDIRLGYGVGTNPVMYSTPTMPLQPNNAPSSTPLYYNPLRELHPPTRPIEDSFILQENNMRSECNSLLGSVGGVGTRRYPFSQEEVIPQLGSRFLSRRENGRVLVSNNDVNEEDDDFQQNLGMNFGSCLSDLQSYMSHMAKDQNGCRFLQKMVAEGTPEDMEMVFNGVIDNVVELMMDPFGNYLVQKLLEFCRDEQRFQIVLMLTREPGQLVRTSLNTHGTRVVQKLISTLKSRRQIALVRSAILPGFLDLIKDLNGNHVIQRCLQCLSVQDNELIHDAATKFLVEVATQQHGCCVLQRCIEFSKGKSHDKLVKEVCKNGFFLAQDAYGNYVVQFIIEMQYPSAIVKLTNQFKGNYVSLSMQKFSSHVVEKCLTYIAETRARIVQELLSVSHFEQMLQDPYANYVVQKALELTTGSVHASLVEAVKAHKILRTSPYCKRIFSKGLLKK